MVAYEGFKTDHTEVIRSVRVDCERAKGHRKTLRFDLRHQVSGLGRSKVMSFRVGSDNSRGRGQTARENGSVHCGVFLNNVNVRPVEKCD